MRPGHLIAALAAAALLAPCAASAAGKTEPPSLPSGWTARGNEPNWMLRLEGGSMVFQPMDGAAVTAALPKPARQQGAWVYKAGKEDLTLTLRPKVCRDTMTGMPSPMTVGIKTGGRTFRGCGGSPSELLSGDWRVVSIGGKPVAKGVTVSIAFDVAAGQVSGASGCNRYFGGFALTGEGLSFKPGMAGSMMACEGAAMRTEEAYKAALDTIQRFDIGKDGALHLLSGDRVVIRAKRGPKS